MLIDHINLYIFDREYYTLTLIGRLAFPLFIYLAVKSYIFYTKNKINYLENILVFAIITFVAVDYFDISILPVNILFTIFFGLIFIFIYEHKKFEFLVFPLVASLYVEYSIFSILAFFGMYLYIKQRDIKSFIILIGSLFILNAPLDNLYLFIFLPLIYIDLNFKIDYKTSLNKYFFYVFYPLHLFILRAL